MAIVHFILKEFLASEKPWIYMSEIFDSSDWMVPVSELQSLLATMPLMNEVHLSCALAIAEHSQPDLFAKLAASLLSHESMSVRINAYRVLRAIPKESIDNTLRLAVSDGLEKCPERPRFGDALSRS